MYVHGIQVEKERRHLWKVWRHQSFCFFEVSFVDHPKGGYCPEFGPVHGFSHPLQVLSKESVGGRSGVHQGVCSYRCRVANRVAVLNGRLDILHYLQVCLVVAVMTKWTVHTQLGTFLFINAHTFRIVIE